jgi:hypothetical protein
MTMMTMMTTMVFVYFYVQKDKDYSAPQLQHLLAGVPCARILERTETRPEITPRIQQGVITGFEQETGPKI